MQAIQTGETDGLLFDLNSKMYHIAEYRSNFKNRFTDLQFNMKDILPEYSEYKNKPSAYFLSPLNYGEKFFGFAALSYGKYALTYDIPYQMFIKYIDDIILRQIEKKHMPQKR